MKANLDAHKCQLLVTVESTKEMQRVRFSTVSLGLSPHITDGFVCACILKSVCIYQNQQVNKMLKVPQVAPQKMLMTFLPGEEKEVEMEVFEPTRGPLDLYILMDFSNSMSDDLDNLKRMGDQLGEGEGQ